MQLVSFSVFHFYADQTTNSSLIPSYHFEKYRRIHKQMVLKRIDRKIDSTWDLRAGENDFVQLCSLGGEVRSVRMVGKHLITYRHENPSVL